MKGVILLIIFTIICILLLNVIKFKEGMEYYPEEQYNNTKTDCQTFCKKLIIKGDEKKCTYFNDNKNIKCYDYNNNLKSPLCEYVASKNICRYNESYNGTLQDIFNRKKPWGIYSAEFWDKEKNLLIDKSGNNNHATTSGNIIKRYASGNGALKPIHYLVGDTSSSILWPEGSIGEKFTICSITRYTGRNNNAILTSQNTDWVHGHLSNRKGVAYYGGWKTNFSKSNVGGNITDWLVMCGKNGSNNENMYYEKPENSILGNSKPIGIVFNGSGNDRLCINKGKYKKEYSNWSVSKIIIWVEIISDEEMKEVCEEIKKM